MVKSFAPLLTFQILTTLVGWEAGAVAGLAVLAGVVLTSKPVRLTWMSAGMLVFLIAVAITAVANPDSGLQDYASTLASGWMGLVVVASITAGHPFTRDFAGDMPESIKRTALYRQTTSVIAWAWVAYFAVATVCGVIDAQMDGAHPLRFVQIVALIAAVKFSIDRPKKAEAQAQQLHGAQA